MAASTTLTKAQAVSLDILISKAMGALTGLRASARNDFPHALAHTHKTSSHKKRKASQLVRLKGSTAG